MEEQSVPPDAQISASRRQSHAFRVALLAQGARTDAIDRGAQITEIHLLPGPEAGISRRAHSCRHLGTWPQASPRLARGARLFPRAESGRKGKGRAGGGKGELSGNVRHWL